MTASSKRMREACEFWSAATCGTCRYSADGCMGVGWCGLVYRAADMGPAGSDPDAERASSARSHADLLRRSSDAIAALDAADARMLLDELGRAWDDGRFFAELGMRK